MAADPARKQAEPAEKIDPKSAPGLWQAFERALYSLKDDGHGKWQGVNDAQRLTIEFNAHEARLTHPEGSVGFHLAGYGYGDVLKAPAAPTLAGDGTRFEYRRGGLTEWYVNGKAGLEQGFTLTQRPGAASAGQPLTIALRVSGDLALTQQGGTVLLKNGDKVVLRYGGLSARDARGRSLPAHLEAGVDARGHEIRMVVDDREAQYPLVVDPLWSQQQEVTASNGAGGAYFGWSVAMSGSTAVVGAPDQNAAYVFVQNGNTWSQQAELTPYGGGGSTFGYSVAMSGTTVVVGAESTTVGSNSKQGSAYVFVQNGGTWSQQAELTSSDGAANDWFGSSVAVSGSMVVVGAQNKTLGGRDEEGAVYVFVQNGTEWPQQAELEDPDLSWVSYFGASVALSGGTLVVGAPEDSNANGAAYFFELSGNTWSQQAKVTASDVGVFDHFGTSVALSGSTAVVGSRDHSGGFGPGAAYVFVNGVNGWFQQAELTAPDGGGGDYYGNSVAVSGATAWVGAPLHTVGGNAEQGAAYVYTAPADAPFLVPNVGAGGAFTQGLTANWNINVTNIGTGSTSGTITVVDTLPSGETLSSYNGSSGWSCSGTGTVTCTETPAAPIGGVATLSLIVNVPANSPTSATNSVVAYGGGDATHTGVSLYDYYNNGGTAPADNASREVKLTDAGRTVYGGGGITPDEKIEAPKSNHIQETLLEKNVFFLFAPVYLANRTVDRSFQVDSAVLGEFKRYLTSQQIPFTEADLDGVMDWLKASIKDKIFTIQFGETEGLRTRADWDPEIQKALTFLPEAQALEDNAHKVMTEKAEARKETP